MNHPTYSTPTPALERWVVTVAQLLPFVGVLFVAFLIDSRHEANFINRPTLGLFAMLWHGLVLGFALTASLYHTGYLIP